MSVYCLFSTRNAKPEYVGRTWRDTNERFYEHTRKALNGNSLPCYKWMRSEWTAGFDVFHADLSVASNLFLENYNDHRRERLWIYWLQPSCNDRLVMKRNEYEPFEHKIEKAITSLHGYCRRSYRDRLYNHEGYIGITYYHTYNAHTAHVYTEEHGFRQAYGDTQPSWDDPIWFSDLVAAIDARDKLRASIEAQANNSLQRSTRKFIWPDDESV